MKHLLTFFYLITFQITTYAQYSWWQENSQTFSRLRNINFADNNTGWVFGDSSDINGFVTGIIKKTSDQGQNWAYQNMGSSNFRIYSSYFFNTGAGVAVGRHQTSGGGIVMRTSNGGSTWVTDSTSIPERLFDIDFAGNSIGWVSGRNGYLSKTTDTGNTWIQLNTGTPEHLFSLDFVDTTYGWAVGADPGTGGTIIRTSDGGSTWTIQSNTTLNDLMTVYAFNPVKAIAAGIAGTIVITTDSGLTWTQVTSGTPEDLFDIKFTDANHGWIVGTAGTILITSDGGNTWTSQVSNTTNNINSICMKDTSLGWYCGDNGDIYFWGFSPASTGESAVNSTVRIYPNPGNGKFTVDLPENATRLQIVNMIGELVYSSTYADLDGRTAFDFSYLSRGIYYCIIAIGEDGIIRIQKIVIN